MTLATHAVVGAAAASFFPANPAGAAAAFCVGFASHFVLDAIPHWDYPIRSDFVDPGIGASIAFNKALFSDALSVGSDGLLGCVLGISLFACLFSPAGFSSALFWLILAGIIGAILPDALQFVYGHWKHEPLLTLQRFHQWIHTDLCLRNKPIIGIVMQILFLIVVVSAILLAKHILT